MKSKILLYGICTTLLIINFVSAGPKHTGWPLEVLSWNIDKAYPGIEYNYRLGVKGGEYPYAFTLVDGPSGMTVNKNTGEIVWTPASLLTDTVVIKISDIIGNSLVHRFAITATKTGFYFVAKNGSNSNDGSEAHPFLTWTHAAKTLDTSAYVYVKKGTYNEPAFVIESTNCGRFMAYPGDEVKFASTSNVRTPVIWLNGQNRIFQGFVLDANDCRYFFGVANAKNMIWRKNEMINVLDTLSENPSHIFFTNENKPWYNMVIQDNVFHDLRDPKAKHGASVTSYNMRNSLFEDNHVYDIDGRGFHEKVGGRRNTIRGNVFHDINGYQGITLNGNPSSDSTEICYNHIYNTPNAGSIMIGLNGTYVANIFIHHNTCVGSIGMQGTQVNNVLSANINIYKNIVGKGANYPYNISPIDSKLYPADFRTKVLIDSNIVFGPSSLTNICGYSWGVPNLNWAQWQDSGKDVNSKAMQLKYDANYIPILPDSLKIYGCYGSDSNIQKHIKNKTPSKDTVLEKDTVPENTLSILPNPFSPDKSASEFKSLSQELGNNAPKGTRISFKLQDEAIKMLKIEILSLAGELVSRIIMQNVLKLTEYHLWWDGRVATKTGINWEELNPVASDVNGRVMSGDKMCRNGRYFVVLSLQNSNSKEKVYKKQVILIK